MPQSGYTTPVRKLYEVFTGVTLSSTAQTVTFNTAGGTNFVLDALYTGASGSVLVFTFQTDSSLGGSYTGLNIGKTDMASGTVGNLTLTWTTSAVNDKIRFPVSLLGHNTVIRCTCSAGGTLTLACEVVMVGG